MVESTTVVTDSTTQSSITTSAEHSISVTSERMTTFNVTKPQAWTDSAQTTNSDKNTVPPLTTISPTLVPGTSEQQQYS